jgi:CzcA family heavy metal efflux pump
LNRLIRWSIDQRLLVLVASAALLVWGLVVARRMPVDVFPDISAPTVTVVAEAHGLAPEEVETLVTAPIETAVNGATGVRRVRSASGVGISIVWVEFDWGTDIRDARQVVNEKLQLVGPQLPADMPPPTMAPVSSVMGEVLFLSVAWKEPAADEAGRLEQAMAARTTADQVLRKRILAVPGVSQVVPLGGAVKQAQVRLRPEAMAAYGVSFEDVAHALRGGSANASGGFVSENGYEFLLRVVGRAENLDAIGATVVEVREGSPILVRDLATVEIGPKVKRGEGSAYARPAVVLAVSKQPEANTLDLTARIDTMLDEIEPTLPAGLVVDRQVFRQSDFIGAAVDNVSEALRDGAILVAVILVLFLGNFRAAAISLAAIPLSLVVSVLVLDRLGISLNTMTLGGLTIAIGSVVDDAIIDVENVYRRLRENAVLPVAGRRAVLDVVYEASVEVRTSIVFATLIIILVFLPLFFLSGVEGRMLAPLGLAYIVSIASSLLVAMTLTPALAALTLPKSAERAHESRLMAFLKRAYAPLLNGALRHPGLVLSASGLALVAALAVVPFLGRAFLPEFNEGALTLSVVTLPGTSLEESDALGRRVEEVLLGFPEVAGTARRTGRAELDEHAQDVNASEIDARLDLSGSDRDKEEFLADLRAALAQVPGAVITVGQPLSHRIDHMLSGSRSAIAIKLFGDDLVTLRQTADKIAAAAKTVPGAVDVSVEQQVDIPALEVRADREALARYGLGAGELAEAVERAWTGETVGMLLEGQRSLDTVLLLDERARDGAAAVAATPIDTPIGVTVPLGTLATISRQSSPNTISREGVVRKMVVQANVAERDLAAVVEDIRTKVAAEVPLPEGYFVVYGGQFESATEATRTIGLLSILVVLGIGMLLVVALGSVRNAVMTLINLPLALIGGVFAVAMTSGVVSIPVLVGFITLFGVATRNGIMMVTHFEALLAEGKSLGDAVVQGSMERLSPILMTALCAGLALVPLVLAADQPGNEIQAPMGVVLLGGLVTSTALNMVVVPVLFRRFGRAAAPTVGSVGGEA